MKKSKKIILKPEWFTLLAKVNDWETIMDFNMKDEDGRPDVSERITLKSTVVYSDYTGKFISKNIPIRIILVVNRKTIDPKSGWYDNEKGRFIRKEEYEREVCRNNDYKIGWFDKWTCGLMANVYDIPEPFANRLIELLIGKQNVHIDITGLYQGRKRPAIRDIWLKSNVDMSDYE